MDRARPKAFSERMMQNTASHFHRRDAKGQSQISNLKFEIVAHRLSFVILTLLLVPFKSLSAENIEPPVSTSNLHQWGAVTLFHGLPSNHVRAIAQDGEGVMWFGTDGGLAKY